MDRDPEHSIKFTRVLIQLKNVDSLAGANPFRIAQDIRTTIGEVKAAKPTSSGALLVTATDPNQASKLLELGTLLDEPVAADIADRQETVEALAYAGLDSRAACSAPALIPPSP